MDTLIEFTQPYYPMMVWLGVISAIAMLVGILMLPWLVSLIPVDILSNHHRALRNRHQAGLFKRVLRNMLGLLLLLSGIVLLITPGQGLLTMLIGLLLMDYPGKRKLEVRMLSKPPVFASINWLRSKRGCPPLESAKQDEC